MDDFYDPITNGSFTLPESGFLPQLRNYVLAAPVAILTSILLTLISVIVATRLLSGQAEEQVRGKEGKRVWRVPYWIPVVGHGVSLFVLRTDVEMFY